MQDTEAELQSLRDATAQGVMGWTLSTIDWAYSDAAKMWQGDVGQNIMTYHAWRPDESDAQCMKVFDRLLSLGFSAVIEANAELTVVSFRNSDNEVSTGSSDERRIAILGAALSTQRAKPV